MHPIHSSLLSIAMMGDIKITIEIHTSILLATTHKPGSQLTGFNFQTLSGFQKFDFQLIGF